MSRTPIAAPRLLFMNEMLARGTLVILRFGCGILIEVDGYRLVSRQHFHSVLFVFFQLLSNAWDDHLSVKYSGVEGQLEFRVLLFLRSVNFSCPSVKLRVEGQLESLGALLSVFC